MPIRKGYADTDQGQLHYRCTSISQPTRLPVVFLHKSASSSRMFEALMTGLHPQYASCALDTPGFGESFDPPEVSGLDYYAELFFQALDRLGIERFHLAGHHTGACIAVLMAAQRPGRVASLALMGPAILTPEEREGFRQHYSAPFNAPRADGQHLQLTWDYLARMGVGDSLELHQREVLDHLRAWKGRTQAYTAVWDQDLRDAFMNLACPILATCAPDDVLWPYFQRLGQWRPDIECVRTLGANFEPDIDASGTLAALKGFLERLDP